MGFSACVPGAMQHEVMHRRPRDRHEFRIWNGPGSAAYRSAALRAAPRPGHDSYFFNPFSSTNAVQRLSSSAMYFVSAGTSASIDSSAVFSNCCLVSGALISRRISCVELLDDRRRQVLRTREPEPDRAVHLRIAELLEGRHVLEHRDALGRGHAERHDRSRRRVLDDRQDRRRGERNVIAEEVGEQRRAAAIRHVVEVGDFFQQHRLDRQLAERAGARRADIDRLGACSSTARSAP